MERPSLVIPRNNQIANNVGQNKYYLSQVVPETLEKPKDGFELLWENIKWFYNGFISPNSTILIIIILVTLFLVVKYYMAKASRKYRQQQREEFQDLEKEIDTIIDDHHTEPYHQNPQPTMNPYNPQLNYSVNYLPHQIPNYIDPHGPLQTAQPSKLDPMMDHSTAGPVDFSGNLDYMKGLNDPYAGSMPSQMIHPYGWSNNFNLETNRYTSSNTALNQYMNNQLKENNKMQKEELLGNYYMPQTLDFPQNIEPPYPI